MAHVPRIHWAETLQPGQTVMLDDERAHHLLRVLKRRVNDPLLLFNTDGEWQARIIEASKSRLSIEVLEFSERHSESPLQSCLVQAISRGDKMDFTVQKAVELGVSCIQPVVSSRGGVQLDAKRLEKKQRHWQAIAQSASEQSGRLVIPQVLPLLPLREWLNHPDRRQGIVMHPEAQSVNAIAQPDPQQLFNILIGPEGGLDDSEVQAATRSGLTPVQLGPRIFRTETAGLVALTVAQMKFGDLG